MIAFATLFELFVLPVELEQFEYSDLESVVLTLNLCHASIYFIEGLFEAGLDLK